MKTMIIAAAALACAALPAAGQPRTDWSQVEIKTTDLGHGVYLLGWRGGDSVVLTGPEGVLLLDTSVPQMGEKIAAAVAKVSGGKPIRYIVNAHAHADHFGSNALLARGGAVIIAQENVRKRMVAGQYLAAFNQTIAPSPPEAWPMVTYTDGLTIHLDGETVDLIHVPNAHTDNDTVVRFERADVVHIGGSYGPGGAYPFYDLSSGGSLDGVIAVQEKVLGFSGASTRLIADEGEPEGKPQLQAQHDAMIQVRARVQALIDQGKSEAEAVAARPTADLDATWVPKGGFLTGDRVVQTAYESLKGLRPGGPPPAAAAGRN
jgi:glyoxylase-like metal-dependent hydrolase (beta-lactamase superfamily II)